MNKKLETPVMNELYKSILLLENVEECRAFFEDLCTITELQSMAQRMEVAKMLHNNVIYSEVAKKTGASTATISRVSRCLNYGNDGYQLVLERLDGKKDV